MKCKPWIRHFSPPKFHCFRTQFAFHGLRALDHRFSGNGAAGQAELPQQLNSEGKKSIHQRCFQLRKLMCLKKEVWCMPISLSWSTFGYFLFFSCLGRGRGSPRRRGGGEGWFFYWKSQEGGEAGRSRGAGRVSAANWGIFEGGGGLDIFFRGRNVHREKLVFNGKRRKNTKNTKESLPGVCGWPLRAALVYRFWPPKLCRAHCDY